MDHRFLLPANLPVPHDDGAAAHLLNLALPRLGLEATDGTVVVLSGLSKAVVFAYPRTGVPGKSPGPEWDAIAGARGCTPQACAFRDLHSEFSGLGVRVFGLSTQRVEFQQEFVARNHVGFPMLSDSELLLTRALRLPTFEFAIDTIGGGGPSTLMRRMTWFVQDGVIRKLWYPVFPPDANATEVLTFVQARDG